MQIHENNNEIKYPYKSYPFYICFFTADKCEEVSEEINILLDKITINKKSKDWVYQVQDVSHQGGRKYKIFFSTYKNIESFVDDMNKIIKKYDLTNTELDN